MSDEEGWAGTAASSDTANLWGAMSDDEKGAIDVAASDAGLTDTEMRPSRDMQEKGGMETPMQAKTAKHNPRQMINHWRESLRAFSVRLVRCFSKPSRLADGGIENPDDPEIDSEDVRGALAIEDGLDAPPVSYSPASPREAESEAPCLEIVAVHLEGQIVPAKVPHHIEKLRTVEDTLGQPMRLVLDCNEIAQMDDGAKSVIHDLNSRGGFICQQTQ